MKFSFRELLACFPGLSKSTLQSWMRRGVVTLSAGSNPGQGTTPTYTLEDVCQVGLAHELANHGLFIRKTGYIWNNIVHRRMVEQIQGDPPGMSVFLMLDPQTGNLMHKWFREDDLTRPDEPAAPALATLLRVDEFIERMTTRMARVKAGLPAIEPDDPEMEIDDTRDEAAVALLH